MNCAKCGADLTLLEYDACAHCRQIFCETCIYLHAKFTPYDTSPEDATGI